jgi:hypothetical protein
MWNDPLMKRTPLVRKTPLKRSPVKRARQSQKRKRPQGFTEEVKAFVRKRSANQCEARAEGCKHKAAHFHHRKLRRHGEHNEANCLHVCARCHQTIHENPELSYVMGWIVPSYVNPAEVPVLHGAG